jgi:hypothetical protein
MASIADMVLLTIYVYDNCPLCKEAPGHYHDGVCGGNGYGKTCGHCGPTSHHLCRKCGCHTDHRSHNCYGTGRKDTYTTIKVPIHPNCNLCKKNPGHHLRGVCGGPGCTSCGPTSHHECGTCRAANGQTMAFTNHRSHACPNGKGLVASPVVKSARHVIPKGHPQAPRNADKAGVSIELPGGNIILGYEGVRQGKPHAQLIGGDVDTSHGHRESLGEAAARELDEELSGAISKRVAIAAINGASKGTMVHTGGKTMYVFSVQIPMNVQAVNNHIKTNPNGETTGVLEFRQVDLQTALLKKGTVFATDVNGKSYRLARRVVDAFRQLYGW